MAKSPSIQPAEKCSIPTTAESEVIDRDDSPHSEAQQNLWNQIGIQKICRVPQSGLPDALSCLWEPQSGFSSRSLATRFIEYARTNHIDLSLCWTCERTDNSLHPTCLVVPNPGKTALLFASGLTKKREFEALSALLQHVNHNTPSSKIRVLQILLTRPERHCQPAILAAGFSHLSDLSYLERRIRPTDRTTGDSIPVDLTLETYQPGGSNDEDFRIALEASYANTLDCPGLWGLRSIDEIMDGHRSTGTFDANLWTLARFRGEPAGVLILTVFADQDRMELTYLGVGDQFRGYGIGKHLVHHAIRAAAEAPSICKMTLAVDDQNAPALALYKKAGFARTDRRTALICVVDEDGKKSATLPKGEADA